jgi:hypothetical protein
MKNLFLLFTSLVLLVSCTNNSPGSKDVKPLQNDLFICQVDNHNESFEMQLPVPARNHNYTVGSYNMREFEICHEYIYLNGKDTSIIKLMYWNSNTIEIDSTTTSLKSAVDFMFKNDFKPADNTRFSTFTKDAIRYGVGNQGRNNIAIVTTSPYFGALEVEIKNCKDTILTGKIINSMQFVAGEAHKDVGFSF